jgi:hypothetical protein
MSITDVHEVLGALDDAGVPVWVDGGWGVDALVRMQSREHGDLDLAIDVARLPTPNVRSSDWDSDMTPKLSRVCPSGS